MIIHHFTLIYYQNEDEFIKIDYVIDFQNIDFAYDRILNNIMRLIL